MELYFCCLNKMKISLLSILHLSPQQRSIKSTNRSPRFNEYVLGDLCLSFSGESTGSNYTLPALGLMWPSSSLLSFSGDKWIVWLVMSEKPVTRSLKYFPCIAPAQLAPWLCCPLDDEVMAYRVKCSLVIQLKSILHRAGAETARRKETSRIVSLRLSPHSKQWGMLAGAEKVVRLVLLNC